MIVKKTFFFNVDNIILETIKNYDKEGFKSITSNKKNIIIKKGFPNMVSSMFRDSPQDVIKHEKGSLPTFDSIVKKKKYSVSLCLNSLFVNLDKNELSFHYIIKKII